MFKFNIQFFGGGGGGDRYSIIFEENGGVAVADLPIATKIPNPLPITTKDNAVFDGWYLDAGLTNPAIPGSAISSNTTLYAKWIDAYTINYYIYDDAILEWVNTETKVLQTVFSKPNNDILLNFYWFSDIEFQNPILVGDSLANNINVYGRGNFNITFKKKTGEIIQVIEKMTTLPLELPVPDEENFDAWYYDVSCTLLANPGDPLEHDVVLYANFIVPEKSLYLSDQLATIDRVKFGIVNIDVVEVDGAEVWRKDRLEITIDGYTEPVTYGDIVVLSAQIVEDLTPLSYQWYKLIDSTYQPLSGQTSNTLILRKVAESGIYKIIAEITDGTENRTLGTAREIIINKAQGIIYAETTQIHPYDGLLYTLDYTLNSEQFLAVVGNLPYRYTEPGTYTITVYAEETANYLAAPEVEVTIIIAVAKIDNTFYDSIASAANAAVAGDTILVIGDAVVDTDVHIANGATLSIAYNDEYAGPSTRPKDGIVITGNGKLIIDSNARVIEPLYLIMDSPNTPITEYFAKLAGPVKDYNYIYKSAIDYPKFVALFLAILAESKTFDEAWRDTYPMVGDFLRYQLFDNYHLKSILVEMEIMAEYGSYKAKPLLICPSFQMANRTPDMPEIWTTEIVKDYHPLITSSGLINFTGSGSVKKEIINNRTKITISGDTRIKQVLIGFTEPDPENLDDVRYWPTGAIPNHHPVLISSDTDIIIASGETFIAGDIIMAAGSSLTIAPGAHVIVNDMVVVESGATFTNNGSLDILGSFGGEINTETAGATINIGYSNPMNAKYYDALTYVLYCMKANIAEWSIPEANTYSSLMSYREFIGALQDETLNLNKWITFFAISASWDVMNNGWGFLHSEIYEMMMGLTSLEDARNYLATADEAQLGEMRSYLSEEYQKTIQDYIHDSELSTSNYINEMSGQRFAAGTTYISAAFSSGFSWNQI